jgi:mono/diheme cytochrome c family protein
MRKLKPMPWVYGCAAGAACCALVGALLIQSPARAQSAGMLNSAAITAADGKHIYEQTCQGCHMPDAKGAVGAGKYPALAGDPALSSRQFIALTVLFGRRNMPAFSAKHGIGFGGPPASLSNAQIAAVVNYVRSNFGNHFNDRITPEEVAALDQAKPPP